MKVLGIVGSPRKSGNTEIIVREALSGAEQAGAETEIVLLREKNIAPCDGCGTCRDTGKCHVKDDMQQLIVQMEAADVILFGSPVYFHTVSGQIKVLMDRTIVFLPEKRLQGKIGVPVLATRRVGGAAARSLLVNFFNIHKMYSTRGTIGYGVEKGEVRQGAGGWGPSAIEEARAAGNEAVEMAKRLNAP